MAASLLGALFAAAPAGAVVSNVPLQAPWVTNGDVNAVAQLGGRTYLGGSFSFVGPRTGPLALLDQSKDGYAAGQASLVPGMPVANGAIYAVASDPSGGWFVGGAFTVIGGVTQPYLAHVDQGQVDQSFVPAIGGPVRALAVAPSALYVGGSFGTASGAKELNVTRVSTLTGAVDPDWEHTDTIGVNGRVNALAPRGIQLYVGGNL